MTDLKDAGGLAEVPFIVCTGGVPGSGKTTLMRRLASYAEHSPSLVVSEDLRREHGLQDPFNADFRARLHDLLAEEVSVRTDRGCNAVLVDSNLLERGARRQVLEAAGRDWKRVFIAPYACLDVLRERVAKKFGVGYMYPSHQFSIDSVIDHSLYFGEPVFLEEALETFDVVISHRTDGDHTRWWTRTGDLGEFARSLARALTKEPAHSSLGSEHSQRIRISSRQDSWCWDPESTGLLAVSPERPATYHARKKMIETKGANKPTPATKNALGDFATSYPGLLRSSLGNTQLIVPSVRVVIHDDHGRILLIRRRDTEEWALIGGAHELDEEVAETARREVREEAGIELGRLDLAAVLSGPKQVVQDRFGNINQGLVFVFKSEIPSGTIPVRETAETVDAAWFGLDQRPTLSKRHELSLQSALRFDGTVTVT
ncbi:NUDIX domain-containing protein [Sphaerisporangium dianthi]|uniref:NUDIX domain-containing protein n=1 Tax=Sphaerisporangium dianthi TaxID=1436120 RepID=A0ABV9CLY2_9ACTN